MRTACYPLREYLRPKSIHSTRIQDRRANDYAVAMPVAGRMISVLLGGLKNVGFPGSNLSPYAVSSAGLTFTAWLPRFGPSCDRESMSSWIFVKW